MEDEATEELKRQPSEEEVVTKLLIDRPSDFKFHAAYLAYSETWDRATSQKAKKELNEIMLSLSKEETTYSGFYRRLDDYRRPGSRHYAYRRKRIETQRKKQWRKRRARHMRNERHGK